MSTYGYEIVQTLIVDIVPDVHVKRAMNEINAGNLNLHVYMYLQHLMNYLFASLISNLLRIHSGEKNFRHIVLNFQSVSR